MLSGTPNDMGWMSSCIVLWSHSELIVHAMLFPSVASFLRLKLRHLNYRQDIEKRKTVHLNTIRAFDVEPRVTSRGGLEKLVGAV